MADEWSTMSLREAGISLIDCDHRTPPAAEHGYPYVAIPQVKDGRINLNGVRHITREHFDEWTRKANPESFDIVLSRRCNPGETGFVTEGLKFALGQNLVLLRSDGRKIFKPFLRWLVRGPQWWDQIGKYINVGAVFDSLKCAEIPDFRLPIPPPSEQRAIAHVLGTLDDKIELNRRMNETLEVMARALFKSWFVDFDPVRAKAALRNHSPLEGESVRQGRSPQPSRWGEIDGETKWGAIKRFYTQQTLQKAQTLRESQTNAEGLLWHYLRDKQLAGYKFRRQQPIGPYIVDFACMPKKLLIELDGGQHAEQHTYDKKRDEFLREKGYKILRFWNNDVFENCFGVLESIRAAVQDPPPQQSAPNGLTTATPPQGGSDWSVERARAYLDRMPPNLADLFPDRLVDSELGPIPEGWEVKALGECFNLTMGQSPPGSTYNEHGEGLPFFQGRTDFGFRYPENRKFCTAPNRIAEPGDTLVSVRAPVGDINMAWEQCCIGRGIAALRHKTTATSYSYYFTWTIQSTLREYEQTGTVFGAINKNQFEALRVLEPDPNIVDAFTACARPLDARIRSSIAELLNLATLRDALLPKLISGETKVGKKV